MNHKSKKNKGFSLVELIIVIAIMAVLVGVLAPQLLKYIKHAKYAKMMQEIDSLNQAVEYFYVEIMKENDFDSMDVDTPGAKTSIYIDGRPGGGGSSADIDKAALVYFRELFGDRMDYYFGQVQFDKNYNVVLILWYYYPPNEPDIRYSYSSARTGSMFDIIKEEKRSSGSP